MYKNNIFKIIFSSSCTVYDDTQTLPWKEHTKVEIQNPYGTSKYIIERILMDQKFDKKWNVVSLDILMLLKPYLGTYKREYNRYT